MRLIDLSQPIFDGAPNCPAHPPVHSAVTSDHPQNGWRWETLTLASHTGSHLDAPMHKLANGASIDSFPLETFVGSARIADFRGIEPSSWITSELLTKALPNLVPDTIVLMSTGWGDIRDRTDTWLYNSPKLHPEAAEWLAHTRTGHRSLGNRRMGC